MKIFENIKMRMNQANEKNKASAILGNDNNSVPLVTVTIMAMEIIMPVIKSRVP